MKIDSVVKKLKHKIVFTFPGFFFKKISYSQEGEDVLLDAFYENRKNYKGFFVDIGAHHPIRFSNTYFFYKKGWKGINIDATPGSMRAFRRRRKRDINLELAVSNDNQSLTFYMFNDPALNTFNSQKVETILNSNKYKLIEKKIIERKSLAQILNKYIKEKQNIDFFSIDVEGEDLNVLKSNDWEKFRPNYILIEAPSPTLTVNSSEVANYLNELNYEPVVKSLRTIFYKDKHLFQNG